MVDQRVEFCDHGENPMQRLSSTSPRLQLEMGLRGENVGQLGRTILSDKLVQVRCPTLVDSNVLEPLHCLLGLLI